MSNGTLLSNNVIVIFGRITTTIQIPDCMHMSSETASYLCFPIHFAHLSDFRVSICTKLAYCDYLFVFFTHLDFST